MRKQSWIFVAGLLVCAGLLNQIISPLWGQPKADADQPATGSPAEQEQALDVRYAQAYLALMEATLARYEESNRAVANTIRPAVIQGIQEAVRKARERVQLAQSDEAGDGQIHVSSAEASLRLAEEALRRAQAANTRSARTVGDAEVSRLQAQVALAKVRVEKARHLASESPLSNVNFELELLREDVQELKLLMALQLTRN
jgi:hypothetical protein